MDFYLPAFMPATMFLVLATTLVSAEESNDVKKQVADAAIEALASELIGAAGATGAHIFLKPRRLGSAMFIQATPNLPPTPNILLAPVGPGSGSIMWNGTSCQ